jgi:hypothetical protein
LKVVRIRAGRSLPEKMRLDLPSALYNIGAGLPAAFLTPALNAPNDTLRAWDFRPVCHGRLRHAESLSLCSKWLLCSSHLSTAGQYLLYSHMGCLRGKPACLSRSSASKIRRPRSSGMPSFRNSCSSFSIRPSLTRLRIGAICVFSDIETFAIKGAVYFPSLEVATLADVGCHLAAEPTCRAVPGFRVVAQIVGRKFKVAFLSHLDSPRVLGWLSTRLRRRPANPDCGVSFLPPASPSIACACLSQSFASRPVKRASYFSIRTLSNRRISPCAVVTTKRATFVKRIVVLFAIAARIGAVARFLAIHHEITVFSSSNADSAARRLRHIIASRLGLLLSGPTSRDRL